MKPFFADQMSQVPIGVKRETLADFERLTGSTYGCTQSSARAALHLIFAHTARYTDKRQHSEQLHFLLWKSVQGGSLIALHMGELIARTLCENTAAATTIEAYMIALRESIKALTKSEYAPLEEVCQKPTFASLMSAAKGQDCLLLIAHYAVIYQITQDLPAEYVNLRKPATGETALALACRLGDYRAAQQLLDLGADPSLCTFDNCSPLHWLFMFDDKSIPKIYLFYHDAVNQISDRPILLNAQLPADLRGSPLSFAIGSGSMTAVDTIISAPHDFQPSTLREAWGKASSLHLHNLIRNLPLPARGVSELCFGFDNIAQSSPVITKLMHGNNLKAARDLTLNELFTRHYIRHSS